MPSLQFRIDSLCANFTADTLRALVKGRLAAGNWTLDDIAASITGRDRSLDHKSARLLAEAAVEALVGTGDAVVREDLVEAR